MGTVGGSEGSENVVVVWLVPWVAGVVVEMVGWLEGGFTCEWPSWVVVHWTKGSVVRHYLWIGWSVGKVGLVQKR